MKNNVFIQISFEISDWLALEYVIIKIFRIIKENEVHLLMMKFNCKSKKVWLILIKMKNTYIQRKEIVKSHLKYLYKIKNSLMISKKVLIFIITHCVKIVDLL